jgi:hypothetical protein
MRVSDLAQQQGAAVAELPGPDAKLMAAVDAGQRLGARQDAVAREGFQGGLGFKPLGLQPQLARHAAVAADPVGVGQGLAAGSRV